jgi:hypothetical protein
MTTEEALRALRCLEWTEEVRPGHPWRGQILVNRREVEKLLKEVTDGN